MGSTLPVLLLYQSLHPSRMISDAPLMNKHFCPLNSVIIDILFLAELKGYFTYILYLLLYWLYSTPIFLKNLKKEISVGDPLIAGSNIAALFTKDVTLNSSKYSLLLKYSSTVKMSLLISTLVVSSFQI